MKKLANLCLAALGLIASTVTLSSCGNGKRIGVLQLATHPALNKVLDGFKDSLNSNNVEYTLTVQNPEGQEAQIASMASNLVLGNELVLGIATSASQGLKKASEDNGSNVPVLFSAVTDPVGANLVSKNTAPGGNVSGCSDMGPVNESIDLLSTYFTSIDSVACLYNISEQNSKQQVAIAKTRIESKGWTFVDKGINSATLVSSTVSSLPDTVDAIYIPTDNMIAGAIASVASSAKSKKLLVVCGDSSMIEGGGILGLGVDYFNLGQRVGLMAVDILLNGKKVGDIDVGYATEWPLTVNKKMADEWGIELPQSLIDEASKSGNNLIQ